jgi:hypothetical protein
MSLERGGAQKKLDKNWVSHVPKNVPLISPLCSMTIAWIFHEIKHPAIGVPWLWKPPSCSSHFRRKKKSHSIKELDRLNIEGKLITRRTELQEVPWKWRSEIQKSRWPEWILLNIYIYICMVVYIHGIWHIIKLNINILCLNMNII